MNYLGATETPQETRSLRCNFMVRRRPSSNSSAPLRILDRIAELSATNDFAALSRFMLNSMPHIVDCDWCSFNEVRADNDDLRGDFRRRKSQLPLGGSEEADGVELIFL